MRRIILLAATAATCLSLVVSATASAKPTPTMTATACRVDASTVRVGVSWSDLAVTGGEIFINIAPLETGYESAWNQKGRQGSHSEDFNTGSDIADLVTVNLYNAKGNHVTFEQREIGEGNNAEEIAAC